MRTVYLETFLFLAEWNLASGERNVNVQTTVYLSSILEPKPPDLKTKQLRFSIKKVGSIF